MLWPAALAAIDCRCETSKTQKPRAQAVLSQGSLPAPALPDCTRVTKNLQRGFQVGPGIAGVMLKLSVENFLEPGPRKNLPELPKVPPDRCCLKQQRSFSSYHLARRAASRPGGQVPGLHG